MKNALVGLLVLGVVGGIGWSIFKPRYPTPMSFESSSGEKHSFADYRQRGVPVLATFVTSTDSFSPRSLALLATMSQEYPAERLGIFAFHVQVADNATLQTMAQTSGYQFNLVSIPKTPGLGIDLFSTMGMKIAGDVAVVNSKGRLVSVIETKDLTQADFEQKVRAAVKKVAGAAE